MDTRSGVGEGQHLVKPVLNTIDQRIPPAEIRRPHAPKMASEMAVGQEVPKGELIQGGRKDVERLAMGDEGAHQRSRDDEVANTKRRKQDFAECPDVNDASHGTHALQGSQRTAAVTVLTVAVVLDDPGLV